MLTEEERVCLGHDVETRLKNKIRVEVYDELTSTFSLAEKMECPSLIICLNQTMGRGRMDRTFFCAPGGIYMNICLKATENLTVVTPAAGVAVCDAINKILGYKCGIKWVNDVNYHGKKVSGILTKAYFDGIKRTMTGIGINYCVPIPPFLQERAASLTDKFRYDSYVGLIVSVTDGLIELTQNVGEIIPRYRRLCETLDKDVIYEGQTVRAVDIASDGGLIVKGSRGIFKLTCGEII